MFPQRGTTAPELEAETERRLAALLSGLPVSFDIASRGGERTWSLREITLHSRTALTSRLPCTACPTLSSRLRGTVGLIDSRTAKNETTSPAVTSSHRTASSSASSTTTGAFSSSYAKTSRGLAGSSLGPGGALHITRLQLRAHASYVRAGRRRTPEPLCSGSIIQPLRGRILLAKRMPIRDNVTFQHPATFVPVAEAEGIMSIDGAAWFVDLLGRIPRLVIDPDLCQEDWGSSSSVRETPFEERWSTGSRTCCTTRWSRTPSSSAACTMPSVGPSRGGRVLVTRPRRHHGHVPPCHRLGELVMAGELAGDRRRRASRRRRARAMVGMDDLQLFLPYGTSFFPDT